MSDPADRRAELNGWIERSIATRRKLSRVLGAGAVIAIGLLVWNRAVGGVAIGILAIVALCGYWIIAAHIADWRGKLDEIGRPRPVGRVIKRR